MNRQIRACLDLQIPQYLPVLLFTPPFDLRILGISHAEYAASATAIVEAHTRAVERFGYHWTFLHVDSCVALEPLGVHAGPADPAGFLPWTPYHHLPAEGKTLDSLQPPDPRTDGRMPRVLDAITRLK